MARYCTYYIHNRTLRVENHVEQKMANDLETRVMQGFALHSGTNIMEVTTFLGGLQGCIGTSTRIFSY